MEAIELNCGLDELFGGGIRTRSVTQIYGPSGIGKSNTALLASVNCVKQGKKVVFIDPEGSFSLRRLAQLAGEDKQKVLDNTFLFEPSSMREQGEIISGLKELDNLGLIVVDSVVYYYRLEMDRDNPQETYKELGLQMASLLDLARKKNLAVLVTNQVYTNIDTGKVEPVGGDVMKYASKIIIEYTQSSPRTARVVKHQFLPSGLSCKFKIVQEGII